MLFFLETGLFKLLFAVYGCVAINEVAPVIDTSPWPTWNSQLELALEMTFL